MQNAEQASLVIEDEVKDGPVMVLELLESPKHPTEVLVKAAVLELWA